MSKVSGAVGSYGARKFVGPFACKSDIVELDALTASVLICVRSARKSDGLFDFTLRVTSLDQSRRGYASHLDMYGVDFDGGIDLIERFIRSMRWQS